LHTVQLMPLPLTVCCFSKIQIGFTFLVPAHPGSPGQRAIKRVCVRVRVRVCVCVFVRCICSSAGVQVPAARSRLQSGDVFILDMGLKVFQWNGSGASVFEKHKVCCTIGRAACTVEVQE